MSRLVASDNQGRVHHHFIVNLDGGVVQEAIMIRALRKCLDNYDVVVELVSVPPVPGHRRLPNDLEMVGDPELTYSVVGELQEVLNARKGVRRLSRGKIKFNVWWPL